MGCGLDVAAVIPRQGAHEDQDDEHEEASPNAFHAHNLLRRGLSAARQQHLLEDHLEGRHELCAHHERHAEQLLRRGRRGRAPAGGAGVEEARIPNQQQSQEDYKSRQPLKWLKPAPQKCYRQEGAEDDDARPEHLPYRRVHVLHAHCRQSCPEDIAQGWDRKHVQRHWARCSISCEANFDCERQVPLRRHVGLHHPHGVPRRDAVGKEQRGLPDEHEHGVQPRLVVLRLANGTAGVSVLTKCRSVR
mmetsp:Transcript_44639/g.126208  ORF Transcript_44639/g.126208 Transcript_44639/m.126208 type:complete len:247 (+) Transcript_44639:895-1635(+)